MVSINIDLSDDVIRAAESQGLSPEAFVRECVTTQMTQLPEVDARHVEYMRAGLLFAEEQVAAGNVVPWNPEDIRRQATERKRKT